MGWWGALAWSFFLLPCLGPAWAANHTESCGTEQHSQLYLPLPDIPLIWLYLIFLSRPMPSLPHTSLK